MAVNWINVNEYSFNCFLLMERFQIRLICGNNSVDIKTNLGIALYYNPAVKWYFIHKCPECRSFLEELTANIPMKLDEGEVRKAEVATMSSFEDFVTYTTPEVMDTHCDFIYAWDKNRLFELADFQDKVVLDVGSGSGRLAFAAAEKARHVYASEPVDTMREYLRDRIHRENIKNISVVDGMADCLPYPDNMFDIVMSGHVVGDDYDAEIKELNRVVKSGGYILDCPGEENRKLQSKQELVCRGFVELHYISKLHGDVFRYWKQVIK